MITINKSDYNLKKILEVSELEDLETPATYHIYGVKDKSPNRAVTVTFDSGTHSKLYDFTFMISSFFQRNGISLLYDTAHFDDSSVIKIGLRKDLRQHPELCANLVKTIVFAGESKIKTRDFNYRMRIPKMPTFRDS